MFTCLSSHNSSSYIIIIIEVQVDQKFFCAEKVSMQPVGKIDPNVVLLQSQKPMS